METVIILTGLMLLVPKVGMDCKPDMDPKQCQWESLTVLIPDTVHSCSQLGEEVRAHQSDIVNLGGAPNATLMGSWVVRSQGALPITVEGRERLLFLDRIYEPGELSRVRTECRSPAFATNCLNGQQNPLLRAAIRFEGGWTVSPIEITRNREPRARDTKGNELKDDATWGFLRYRYGQLPLALTEEFQFAGGLLLRATGGATVTFPEPVGNAFSTLSGLGAADCLLAVGVNAPCAIVRFQNAINPLNCDVPTRERLEIDHHHNILYELFELPPEERYLLFFRKDSSEAIRQELYPGGGGTVGCRPCIPPVFADPVR